MYSKNVFTDRSQSKKIFNMQLPIKKLNVHLDFELTLVPRLSIHTMSWRREVWRVLVLAVIRSIFLLQKSGFHIRIRQLKYFLPSLTSASTSVWSMLIGWGRRRLWLLGIAIAGSDILKLQSYFCGESTKLCLEFLQLFDDLKVNRPQSTFALIAVKDGLSTAIRHSSLPGL